MGKQHPVGYLSCVLTYVRTRKGKGGVSCDVRIVHRARHYNWDDIKREFEGITFPYQHLPFCLQHSRHAQ